MTNVTAESPANKTLDPTDCTYTIVGVDGNANPYVEFNCDGSVHCLGSCPTDSIDDAQAYILAWVQAYITGLQQVAVTPPETAVSSEFSALIGQTITPSDTSTGS